MLDKQLSEFEGFSKGMAYDFTNYPLSCTNYIIQYRTDLPFDYISQYEEVIPPVPAPENN